MPTAAKPLEPSFLDPKVLSRELTALLDRHPERLAARRPELRTLADDLEQGNRLQSWAELALVETFVRPESLTAPSLGSPSGTPWWRRAPRDGVLEAVLGVLVFVPLLVTWFGLREAVRAYGELSREDPKQATRPFLQLWQTGFDGHLAAVGRFENVALMAVVLITLLVLLSVWHAHARTRAEREEESRHDGDERLLGSLASLLSRVQLCLDPHRAASPDQFSKELTRAAQQLQALLQKANGSHKRLADGADAVAKATDALQQAAGTLSAEVPRLATAADRVEAAVTAGTSATDQVRQDSKESARIIADKLQSAAGEVQSAFSSLIAEQKALASTSGAAAQAAEQAARAIAAGAGRTNDVVDGMREATERWDAAAAHWQDAAARLDQAVRALAARQNGGVPGPSNGALGTQGTMQLRHGIGHERPEGGDV
ncbi:MULTISPECIES: hypothetical protein [unclassified Streptomyces]|uniref:hypothetical protein n=1 Tax=unclassified Streptomyces TaxID=2593676 RepID=UPI002252A37B|nr:MULTISPECIES: hypothetical protein [unclassified Streptomyces]MCX5051831.1 hypothetical protein [Streptomyces sp. NBC_00474]MCX5249725.1 hypothetical protein [Streptomyces sp. NBC_00201]